MDCVGARMTACALIGADGLAVVALSVIEGEILRRFSMLSHTCKQMAEWQHRLWSAQTGPCNSY